MKYRVLTPLRHDGEDKAEGDEIELTAKAAEPLVVTGAIERAEKTTKKPADA